MKIILALLISLLAVACTEYVETPVVKDSKARGHRFFIAPVLKSEVFSGGVVELSWVDAEAGIKEFIIERNSGNGFNEIASVSPATFRYQDISINSGGTYAYRVAAKNGLIMSVYSNIVDEEIDAINFPPHAPTELAVTATTANSATLEWKDNSNDESSFSVEAKAAGSAIWEVNVVGLNEISAVLSGLVANKDYTFRVRAKNMAGYSDYSNEVSGKTSEPDAPPQVSSPAFNPSVVAQSSSSVSVTATSGTAGATVAIYSGNSCGGGIVGTGSFTASGLNATPTWFSAKATKTGFTDSDCIAQSYSYTPPSQVNNPVFSPSVVAQSSSSVSITATTTTPGATVAIYSGNSCSGGIVGTGSYTASGLNATPSWFSAKATNAGFTDSACIAQSYSYTPPTQVNNPVFSPNTVAQSASSVSMTATTSTFGATVAIYSGNSCSGGIIGTGSFTATGLNATPTWFSARASNAGTDSACIAQSYSYSPPSQVANPAFNPNVEAQSSSSISITATTTTPGATVAIYSGNTCNGGIIGTGSYTLNGLNAIPIWFSAKATNAGFTDSACIAQSYSYTAPSQVASPVFSPNVVAQSSSSVKMYATTSTFAATVAIYSGDSCGGTPVSYNFYTANGLTSNPTWFSAKATKTGSTSSDCIAQSYSYTPAPKVSNPAFSPSTVAQSSSSVTMSAPTSTSGATVTIYSGNNCNGTILGNGSYTASGLTANATSFSAKATNTGFTDSDCVSQSYTYTAPSQVANPAFSQSAVAQSSSSISVTATTSTPSATVTIYSGSNCNANVLGTSSFSENSLNATPKWFSAKATKPGFTDSACIAQSYSYTAPPAAATCSYLSMSGNEINYTSGSTIGGTYGSIVGQNFPNGARVTVNGVLQPINPGAASDSTTLRFYTLKSDVAGAFQVSAVSSQGVSLCSTPEKFTYVVSVKPTAFSFSAVAGNGVVTITRTANETGSNYAIYRGTSSGSYPTTVTAITSSLSYNDTTVTNGTKYFYKVVATNPAGSTNANAEASATPNPPTQKPSAFGFTALAGNGVVTITRTYNELGVTYAITRGTSSGSYPTIVTSSTTSYSYNDTSVTNGTRYYYMVYATNAGGTTNANGETFVTPNAPVSAPAAFTISAVAGNGSVTISRASSVVGVTYKLYRGTTQGSYPYMVTGDAGAVVTTDSGLSNGTKYYYLMTATNAGGTTNSNEASATPAVIPLAFTISAVAGNGVVTITRSSTQAGVTYKIYRGTTSSGAFPDSVSENATAASYSDYAVTNGTKYYYISIATNTAGVDGSNEASATPSAPLPVANPAFNPSTVAQSSYSIPFTTTTTTSSAKVEIYSGSSCQGSILAYDSVRVTGLSTTPTWFSAKATKAGQPDSGCVSQSYTYTPPPPTLTFTPASGPPGTQVTVSVTGRNFTNATAVYLNGTKVAASPSTNSAAFVVPFVNSGAIKADFPGETLYSSKDFTVTAATSPGITSLSANAEKVGGTIIITGTNLTYSGTTTVVKIGGVQANHVGSATSLTVTIPAGAGDGVTITNPAGTATYSLFWVSKAAGKITSFSPTTVKPGEEVTITGTNLAGVQNVSVGAGSFGKPTSNTNTTIKFKAPASPVTGKISVSTPYDSSIVSTDSLKVKY